MKVSQAQRTRRRRTKPRTEIVRVARQARFNLARVVERVELRRREELALNEVGELAEPIVVPLTDEEQLEQLQIALTWLQRAENDMRQVRALIERQLERETKEVL